MNSLPQPHLFKALHTYVELRDLLKRIWVLVSRKANKLNLLPNGCNVHIHQEAFAFNANKVLCFSIDKYFKLLS